MLLQSSIQSVPKPWNISFHITETGRNNIQKWGDQLSVKGRARRDVAIKFLRVQPLERWMRPQVSPLGKHLYVIHFHDENGTAHRLCGFADVENHVFVICVSMVEKDGVYKPDDYEQRTLAIQKQISTDLEKYTAPCPWGAV